MSGSAMPSGSMTGSAAAPSGSASAGGGGGGGGGGGSSVTDQLSFDRGIWKTDDEGHLTMYSTIPGVRSAGEGVQMAR